MPLSEQQFKEAIDTIMSNPESRKKLLSSAAQQEMENSDEDFAKAVSQFLSLDIGSMPDGPRKIARDTIVEAAQKLAQLTQFVPPSSPGVGAGLNSLSPSVQAFAKGIKMPGTSGRSGMIIG